MYLYGYALSQESMSGVHEIYNFWRPLEKKIFKEIKHFHYMSYMAMP